MQASRTVMALPSWPTRMVSPSPNESTMATSPAAGHLRWGCRRQQQSSIWVEGQMHHLSLLANGFLCWLSEGRDSKTTSAVRSSPRS
jgi:hypothetical protein